jgi:hypothetical protein
LIGSSKKTSYLPRLEEELAGPNDELNHDADHDLGQDFDPLPFAQSKPAVFPLTHMKSEIKKPVGLATAHGL